MQQLYAAAFEANLAGNHALEQKYLAQAKAVERNNTALKNYILLIQGASAPYQGMRDLPDTSGVPSSSSGTGGHGWYDDSGGFHATATKAQADEAWRKAHGYQHGGQFIVGGGGGPDSQLVQFRASPREKVTITPPGGGNDQTRIMIELVAEVRRLTTTMPTIMRDALQRL
jgi:hypothetical protein